MNRWWLGGFWATFESYSLSIGSGEGSGTGQKNRFQPLCLGFLVEPPRVLSMKPTNARDTDRALVNRPPCFLASLLRALKNTSSRTFPFCQAKLLFSLPFPLDCIVSLFLCVGPRPLCSPPNYDGEMVHGWQREDSWALVSSDQKEQVLCSGLWWGRGGGQSFSSFSGS